jgi:SecD/SecF fusion protein
MQGKGIIKMFLILLTIVSIIQYLYMYPTYKAEKAADDYAIEAAEAAPDGVDKYFVEKEARIKYLDSISSEEIFKIPMLKSFTYDELKRNQLNFGLDLKGGMSAVLEVNLRELIYELASKKNETLNNALDAAEEAKKSSQSDFVTLFGEEYDKIADGQPISRLFLGNPTLREDINAETSDGEVIRVLREKATQTVNLTFNMLKQRIDKLGVTQPNVSLDAGRDLILVEMPGMENPERARNFLQASAKLEFWRVFRITDPGVQDAFVEADKRLKGGLDSNYIEAPASRFDTIWTYSYDSITGVPVDSTLVSVNPVQNDPFADLGPLLSKLALNVGNAQTGYQYSFAVMGSAQKNKMNAISALLKKPEISILFPRNLEFRWSAKPRQDVNTGDYTKEYLLYGIKKEGGQNSSAPLEGDKVISASQTPDPVTGEPTVSLQMNSQGAKIWADMTTEAANDNNREVAISLDSAIVSAPRVNEPITGGRSSISGGFKVEEAIDLSNILEIGKLPATTKIIQESTVGPSLGKDNINRSLKSLIAGFSLLLLFMIFYYGSAGIVSIIALFANLFFIFGALASVGTVLTLPGIAGIVLTIGMAVDANVIIFERIKEELRSGKSMLASINDGFKFSYSAIIDANVTTILTAGVLAYWGMGPIKGFAVVLGIGVLSSLFTAVLLGKMMIDWWVSGDRKLSFWTPASKSFLANLKIDWMGKRKIAYIVSTVVLIGGLTSILTRGFDLGVDFTGGYSYNVQFEAGDIKDKSTLREDLLTIFDDASTTVKAVDTENTFNIVTSYLIDEQEKNTADSVMTKLYQGINGLTTPNLDFDKFKLSDTEGVTHVTSSSKVGPTIADDIKTSSYYAATFALLLIFLYIFIRFSKWQFSLGAVAALFHDSLIVLSVFSILHGVVPWSMELDQAFIAAILTVIGYSINDTVVVFDRIREYLGIYTDKSTDEVLNMAISSTLSRTVITSFTTLLVVGILFFFGGGTIKGFSFALLIGILVGTYSSIFVATPLVRDLSKELKARESKTKKSFSRAIK